MHKLFLMLALASASPAVHARSHQTKSFKVGTSTFTGTAKTICVIKGSWKDGTPFRYEAWDECSRMVVRQVPARSLGNVISLGEAKRSVRASDIPLGAQVLELSNAFSRVLIFKDAAGRTQEILAGD